MRIAEASFLINNKPEQLRYLAMDEFIRDSFMVLIGVPSQTFQLEKVRVCGSLSTNGYHSNHIGHLPAVTGRRYNVEIWLKIN